MRSDGNYSGSGKIPTKNPSAALLMLVIVLE